MKTLQTGPMTTLKRRVARFGLGLGLAATLALSAVMPALADGISGSVEITGGDLSLVTTPTTLSYSGVSLDGTNQTATATLALTVRDDTGSHAGWHLSISGATLTGGVTSATLAAPTITGVTPTTEAGQTGTYTQPSSLSQVSYPYTVPTSAATFYKADADTGVGRFAISTAFSLSIPANATADTYTSAIVVSVDSAP
jgi:hypothetical protein